MTLHIWGTGHCLQAAQTVQGQAGCKLYNLASQAEERMKGLLNWTSFKFLFYVAATMSIMTVDAVPNGSDQGTLSQAYICLSISTVKYVK